MDLRKAGIGEEGSLLVALPGGGTVGIHRIGGKEIGISVAAGSEHHRMGAETLDFTGHEVAGDDSLGLAVDDHEVQHLVTGIALDGSCGDFLVQGSIGAEQELLAGLSAGIERTADLDTAEGAVRQIAAVLTRKRNTLGYALVYDGGAHFREPVDIGFAAPVVATLDGIIEKAVHGVVVILVVLRGIDTALRRNRVGAARGIADTEDLDIVSEFSERSRCRCTAKTGTYDDYLEFPLVVGTDDPDFGLAPGPFLGERPFRNLGN